jgi:DNA-binding NtrC family response regulator
MLMGRRILLADDDSDQLSVREMLFQQLGFEVLTATGREGALEQARLNHPVCAVIDLRLPDEESGLRLIRDLKNLVADMRIFVLTGGRKDLLEGKPERKLVAGVFQKGDPMRCLVSELEGAAAATSTDS